MPFIPISQTEQLEHLCKHPEHNPPTMILLPPGLHRWECPACGKITDVFESKIRM